MKKLLLFTLILISIVSLRVNAQLSSPVLTEPPKEADVVLLPVTVSWNSVPGALCYRVEITADTTDPEKFLAECNAPQTHYEIPISQTENNTVYYWRVFACGPSGWSEPSPYFSFRTQSTSTVETIQNLQDGVIDLIVDEEISPAHGNQLINRLNHVINRLNNNQRFLAALNAVLFKTRVYVLRFSNQISAQTFTSLDYSIDGVIDLIVDEEKRFPSKPKFEDYLIPKNFELSQNYPNPFNPSTTIEYSIPKDANVTLKIYDVLGKEVATLVNEQKSAGTYIVNWNASNLSSGAYFYRITAGEFTATKKMFLLK